MNHRDGSQRSGSVSTFAWRGSGKPFRKNHPHYYCLGSNFTLPVIGSLVYCESDALDRALIAIKSSRGCGSRELKRQALELVRRIIRFADDWEFGA
uniref:Uncharacterized protein n=1 Tax=Timema tahoe TaxID=61484 RepID=A0A7R9FEG8_9NEOP|nr:unnamed protein product [Timema tahoe]